MSKLSRRRNYRPELTTKLYARDKDFSFTPSDDFWQLGVSKRNIHDMRWLHESELPFDVVEYILTCLAWRARSASLDSFHSQRLSMSKWVHYIMAQSTTFDTKVRFIMTFETLNHVYQRSVLLTLREDNATDYQPFLNTKGFIEFLAWLDNNRSNIIRSPKSRTATIVDPEKGAHTQTELTSIFEAIRQQDNHIQTLLAEPEPTAKNVYQTGVHLAFVLMFAILRRPTQLRALKLVDLRQQGQSFNDNTIQIPLLVESDELLLRVFKSKNSVGFRGEAERLPQVIISELSNTVVRYIKAYVSLFTANQRLNGIILNPQEHNEILQRLPLFPTYDVLTAVYLNKQALFSTFGVNSQVGHFNNSSIISSLRHYRVEKLAHYLKSERLPAPNKMTVGNNRIRHTVLTNAAINGSTAEEIAAITGVTSDSVKAYIDFSLEARQLIDDAFEDNKMIDLFTSIRIREVLKRPEFAVINAYGEVFGELEDKCYCGGCKAELPRPLGCYICDNFHPLAEADHNSELEKAKQKYAINLKHGQSRRSMRLLNHAIYAIEEVIKECERQRKTLYPSHTTKDTKNYLENSYEQTEATRNE